MQEGIDAALPRPVAAYGGHQFRRDVADSGTRRVTRIGDPDEFVDERLLVGEIARVDFGDRACIGKRLPSKEHRYTRLLVSLVLPAS